MKFYNRESEILILAEANEFSKKQAQMTVIMGRRRVGKTRLILKSVENQKYIYFFVSKKNEALLCNDYVDKIKNELNIPIYGTIQSFREIFGLLLNYSKTNAITLIIDEFQDFNTVNASIFSEMQNLWDQHKHESKMNLIISGSIFTIMKRIFEDQKEPLFGRATTKIELQPFNIETLKNIISDHYTNYTNKDLLAFYAITGGVARYVEYFADKNKLSLNKIITEFIHPHALLLNEGKSQLIEDFGKEYGTYFSILSLIAMGKTSRQEIESILQKNIGGYLNLLENGYSIIQKHKPIFSKPGSHNVKFFIKDNFLSFWFHFIYTSESALAINNFDFVKSKVLSQFDEYSGKILEKYFINKLADTGKYDKIGQYWEKGNKNEIDIVAINSLKKEALIGEVKLNKKKINLENLKIKSKKLVTQLKDFKITYSALSLEDM